MNCSPPGPSVYGIFPAIILEWVAVSYSRVSSQHRDWTHVSCIAGRFFTTEPPGKPFSITPSLYLLLFLPPSIHRIMQNLHLQYFLNLFLSTFKVPIAALAFIILQLISSGGFLTSLLVFTIFIFFSVLVGNSLILYSFSGTTLEMYFTCHKIYLFQWFFFFSKFRVVQLLPKS